MVLVAMCCAHVFAMCLSIFAQPLSSSTGSNWWWSHALESSTQIPSVTWLECMYCRLFLVCLCNYVLLMFFLRLDCNVFTEAGSFMHGSSSILQPSFDFNIPRRRLCGQDKTSCPAVLAESTLLPVVTTLQCVHLLSMASPVNWVKMLEESIKQILIHLYL